MRLAVWILGQSNAVRQLVGYPVAYDIPASSILAQRTAASQAAFESTGWDVDQVGDLRPRIVNGTGRAGIEQSLGRGLVPLFSAENIVVIRTAISGTNFNTFWDPSGGWPTLNANVFTQSADYVRSILSAYNAKLGVLFHVAGEGDANAATDLPANAYLGNMIELHDLLNHEFGQVVYIASQIAYPGVWNPTRRDIVRNAVRSFHDPERLRGMVGTDDLETADGQHWLIDSLMTIGTRGASFVTDELRLRAPKKFGRWRERFS